MSGSGPEPELDPESAPHAVKPARRGCLGRLLWVYLALLAASHSVRYLRDGEPRPRPESSTLELRAVTGTRRAPRVEGSREDSAAVTLAFGDSFAPGGEPQRAPGGEPVVLLLHGSPGRGRDLEGVAAALGGGFRTLTPDLPGFGGSSRDLPDYSIEAHADYMLQALDLLGIDGVHLVAHSMGGGVALHLADRAPERVRSVTMIAAIGVQELELFGSYELNRLVHGGQLALIRAVELGVPHFGALDDFPLDHAYARNFFDTDQRPLRGMLERLAVPLQIVHGEHDFLVVPEVAREHARIVPSSELHLFPDHGHFIPWTQTDAVAGLIADFVQRAEAGVARQAPDAARLAAAAEPFDYATIPPFAGPALLVVIALIILATLVSEDLTCIGVGLLISQGRLGFVPGALACVAGIYIGDILLFLLGRYLGRSAIERAPLRWFVKPSGIERASAWFRERGVQVIFLSRLMPGLRLPTYVAAGLLRTSFARFSFFFLVADLIWTPLLVGVAVWLGDAAFELLPIFERYSLPALLGLAALLLLLQRIVLPLFTHRGRRLLFGAWRRKTAYEFWPLWLFYIPVVAYIAYLAVRFRGLRFLRRVNPAIPGYGLQGESKADILERLAGGGEFVARHVLLPSSASSEARLSLARVFLGEHQLDYPIVIKPDVGERGKGVEIARSEAALRARIAGDPQDLIVQEFVPDHEFGVFYYRFPGAERGRIFSLASKVRPRLVGDGTRTLEELILDDARAVCMAQVYFDANAGRLDSVPATGEEVELVELGNHCLGAIFLDAREHLTPELEQRFDALSHAAPGFHFGRYDVRVSSLDEFRAGRGFKILELNGLASEAAHIYDPAHGLLPAWRDLCRQWRIAFEIAAAQRARSDATA